MEFLFPNIANQIEWSKPCEHLDKELLAIQKTAKIKNKLSDKLIKVYKKTGEETWVILHVEIQGTDEKDFAERLFQYYYKIYNRYQMPLATIAILTDTNKNWRPTEFQRELWGCRLVLQFPIIKLLDYLTQQDILEQSTNPIAKVIQAHLAALVSKGSTDLKFREKLRLVKNLYSLGYTRDIIIDIYEFINYTISLPDKLEGILINEIKRHESEVKMPYITSIEKRAIKQGIEQGIEQGVQLMFLDALNEYCSAGIPQGVQERVEKATMKELRQWFKEILEEKFNIEELAV